MTRKWLLIQIIAAAFVSGGQAGAQQASFPSQSSAGDWTYAPAVTSRNTFNRLAEQTYEGQQKAAARLDEITNAERIAVRAYSSPGVTGEFLVDEDGTISIPMLGRISVRGLNAAELEIALSAKAAEIGGSLGHLTVEVVEYRPVYVTGFVNTSGAVEWRPGMTVLQAVALSGGLFRSKETPLSAAEIERGQRLTQQELSALQEQRTRLTEQLQLRQKQSSDLQGLQAKGIVAKDRALEEQLKASDLEERLSNVTVAIARVQALSLDYESKLAQTAPTSDGIKYEVHNSKRVTQATEDSPIRPDDILVVLGPSSGPSSATEQSGDTIQSSRETLRK